MNLRCSNFVSRRFKMFCFNYFYYLLEFKEKFDDVMYRRARYVIGEII